MPKIKFQCSGGEILEVDDEIARVSVVIKSKLKNQTLTDDSVIPLPGIKANILDKVMEWITYQKDVLPVTSEKEKRSMDETWETEFFKLDHGTLFKLMIAAYDLKMNDLVDETCKAIATTMHEQTPKEVRKVFNYGTDSQPIDGGEN